MWEAEAKRAAPRPPFSLGFNSAPRSSAPPFICASTYPGAVALLAPRNRAPCFVLEFTLVFDGARVAGAILFLSLDESHRWAALRYVEMNPVRARMVESAEQWRWSRASAHCGAASPDAMLEMDRRSRRWTKVEWCQLLADAESLADLRSLRQSTHTGRPFGTPEFVAGLETLTLRPLAPKKGGRLKRVGRDSRQMRVSFAAYPPHQNW